MTRTAALFGTMALLATASLPTTVNAAAQAAEAPVPRANEAMAAICGQPAQDAGCMLQGREMTYWVGFQSVVEGRRWYTVVAFASDHLASDEGDGLAPSSGKVRISQVTYEAVGGKWKLIARQLGFGSIATNNSGNPVAMVDTNGQPFVREIPGGALIGYPTQQMAGEGITLHTHSMFRSAPDKSGRWLYGGDIFGGSDNGAGCDEEEAPHSCYASTATLALTGKAAGLWPEVRTTVSGTVSGPNRRARPARPSDGAIWRFDASEATYTSDAPR